MNRFTKHLSEANESYFEHFCHAISFSGRMLFGAFACAIHALLPFAFEKTGSSQITELHQRMVVNRQRTNERSAAQTLDLNELSTE